jgi:AhpD family alkylhydroperoxidase
MLEQPRFAIAQLNPEIYRHLREMEGLIAARFEPKLYHLIKLRASQINGCAFCLQMHTAEALKDGESPERMTALDAWEESPLFSDKERAALAWVEELTLIADSGASTTAYDALKPHFDEEQIGWLVLAVVQINSWNRIAISARARFDPNMFAAGRAVHEAPEPA